MKRTCLTFTIIICLPLFLCAPALARHAGPYAGLFAGGTLLPDSKSSDSQGDFSLTFDPGIQESAVIGWELEQGNPLGEGRIELEYSHRSNPLNEVKFVEGNFQGDGDLTADSLLINVFAVYHDNSRWAPYFGVGIGAARIKADDLQVSGQPLSSDSATVFAYQLGIGCEYGLTDSLSLDLGYRYFGSSRPKFSEENGESFNMDYASHSLVLGVKVGF